jgi:hypothetical protein
LCEADACNAANRAAGGVKQDNVSTDGIDLVHWALPHPSPPSDAGAEAELCFTVFDFAGQETYYAAHQLFLTLRCVFVVVYKGTTEGDQLRFWLNSLSAFADNDSGSDGSGGGGGGGGVPRVLPTVLLVCTHKDDVNRAASDPSSVLAAVKTEFEGRLDIRSIHHVSTRDTANADATVAPYEGVKELRTTLVDWATQLPGVRMVGFASERTHCDAFHIRLMSFLFARLR